MVMKIVAVAATALMLVGCAQQGGSGKQAGGAVLGGLAGGLAGSQIGSGEGQLWATGAGVLLGALIGSEVGKSLDRADKLALEQNTQRSFTAPLNEPIIWDNPNNGNQVVVTPTREGSTTSGSYCREYQQTITVGGRKEDAFGTACRQPDGSWKVVS